MQKSILRKAFVLLILGAALSSCSQLLLRPKFGYLNKVAATALCNADTLRAHISEWKEIRHAQQRVESVQSQTNVPVDSNGSVFVMRETPGPIEFSLNETKRILMQYHEILPVGYRSDSKASAYEMNGWVLGLLVFFGSLVLFAVLIAWAIQKQMGCLASGLAVFALLFEIWLVMFVLM